MLPLREKSIFPHFRFDWKINFTEIFSIKKMMKRLFLSNLIFQQNHCDETEKKQAN